MRERLKPPWTVHRNADAYWVEDQDGHRFAYVYYRTTPLIGTDNSGKVSADLARRIVANVARMPDMIRALQIYKIRR